MCWGELTHEYYLLISGEETAYCRYIIEFLCNHVLSLTDQTFHCTLGKRNWMHGAWDYHVLSWILNEFHLHSQVLWEVEMYVLLLKKALKDLYLLYSIPQQYIRRSLVCDVKLVGQLVWHIYWLCIDEWFAYYDAYCQTSTTHLLPFPPSQEIAGYGSSD